MGVLSLVAIAIFLAIAALSVTKRGIFTGFLKDKKQDEVMAAQSERIDELEKQFGVMLDVVLELEGVDAGDFSKRLLQAQYNK